MNSQDVGGAYAQAVDKPSMVRLSSARTDSSSGGGGSVRGLEHLSATSSKFLALAGFALLGMPVELEGRAVLALSHSRSITQTDLLALALVTVSACLFLAVGPGLRQAAQDPDCRVLSVLTLGLACLYVYLGDGSRWLCLLAGVAAYGAVQHALRRRPDVAGQCPPGQRIPRQRTPRQRTSAATGTRAHGEGLS